MTSNDPFVGATSSGKPGELVIWTSVVPTIWIAVMLLDAVPVLVTVIVRWIGSPTRVSRSTGLPGLGTSAESVPRHASGTSAVGKLVASLTMRTWLENVFSEFGRHVTS